MHSLFVYGTLRPQQPNAHVMNGLGEAGKPVIFVGICSSAVGVLSWVARVFSSVIRERLFRVMYSYPRIFPNIGMSWMHLKAMNINVSRLKYIWKMVRR